MIHEIFGLDDVMRRHVRALPPVPGPSRRPTFSNFVMPTPMMQILLTFR
jgi:hypothetical protein